MVCKELIGTQIQATRTLTNQTLKMWSDMVLLHPAAIFAKWMAETYIETMLSKHQPLESTVTHK